MNQDEEAVRIYNQALASIKNGQTETGPIYYAAAISYDRLNQKDKAEEFLLKAKELSNNNPNVLNYLGYTWRTQNKNIDEVMTILNKKSCVLGLSENFSSDFRDLERGYDEGMEASVRAVKVFCYRVAKYIGAYTAAMNGVDVICFTAGIGENTAFVRTLISEYLGYLGIKLDEDANHKRGEEIAISTPDSKTCVLVIPTNEELAIARETVRLV